MISVAPTSETGSTLCHRRRGGAKPSNQIFNRAHRDGPFRVTLLTVLAPVIATVVC